MHLQRKFVCTQEQFCNLCIQAASPHEVNNISNNFGDLELAPDA